MLQNSKSENMHLCGEISHHLIVHLKYVCIYFFVITSKIHPSTEIRDKNLISSKVVTFLYVLRSYVTRRKKS